MITPLVSIIKTQAEELQSIGIKAINIANEEIYTKEVEGGESDIIFNTRNMD